MLRVAADGLQSNVSNAFEVVPGPAVRYALYGPTTVVAGESATFTATAQDSQGNSIPDYAGTAAVTVSDTKAKAPPAMTFTRQAGTPVLATFWNLLEELPLLDTLPRCSALS